MGAMQLIAETQNHFYRPGSYQLYSIYLSTNVDSRQMMLKKK
jgi:hypothetical protein